ncbi:hypothetical protein HYPSUDRAFT_219725 [Hypholoma sublateritium FD-334 SS-4]|uniref:G domain-containing protein n=1 Tax=Hypholoma sublateritium (strain FD-334 SS-4) TaxID=945553 RepID=A0A0D2P6E2_HYPSF|nr:hypothetical protein HYPSUDRAFT_219725 [Hypholoma sublateritium FD-334 SS-4]
MSVSPEVSSSLKSCTQSVAAYTVYSLGNNSDTVTLVDTPGFNDSESGGDRAQLNRIIGWLKNNPDMHLIGVLYLHNIKNARVTLSPNVVGPREIVPLPPGVLVVTSHWGGSPSPKDISLEAEFQKQFCGQNAMVRFDGTRDSAWAAIRQLQSAGVSIPLKNFETRLQKMHDLLPDDKMQARRFARMTYPGWIAKMFH